MLTELGAPRPLAAGYSEKPAFLIGPELWSPASVPEPLDRGGYWRELVGGLVEVVTVGVVIVVLLFCTMDSIDGIVRATRKRPTR